MKVLLLVLALALPLVVGYLMGRANRSSPPDQKAIKEELAELRETQRHLTIEAAKHATLGDDFAVIALGILNPEVNRDGQ